MWNCDPCTPLKYGPGFHSCDCFSFLALVLFVLHVIVSICPFVTILVHAFVATLCFHYVSWPVGLKGPYFILCTQLMWKTSICCWGLANISSLWSPLPVFFPSVSQCHTALCHLALCGTAVATFCPPSHAQQGLLMPLHPPTHPHSGGETVSAPSAHQIPTGPLWSTGGEFREQPLVVPTQRPSFTEGLIKPDNIPSALALLFSQLNAKWQLKASPRCRY